MKHTPGPWTATDPHEWLKGTPRFKCSIRYGNNKLGNSLAEVYLGGPGALSCDAESVNANARLIAAAPEMLEALQDVAETLDKMAPCPEEILDRLLACAQSAIKTATGIRSAAAPSRTPTKGEVMHDDNFLALCEATKDMTAEQREEFENYFIGSLGIQVSKEDWQHAIRTASRCYENGSRRKHEKCARCGVSLLSYYPTSDFDDVHHRSRDGERPMIRCATIVNKTA